MPTSRSIQRELDSLKKEIAGLRAEGKRVKKQAAAVASNGASTLDAIKDEIADKVSEIKDTLASGASGAADEISEQLEELREKVSEYSGQAEDKVKAHPFVAVAGALAVGWLIGRLTR
jgi:ElaB/YqjD/DUF883 family membrane-anchored ribosome-binding protein